LVEKAWRRIDPPTQEELRIRLGLSARTNLSKLNKGTMLMTLDYAERIVTAVRKDDPTFSVADLGATSSLVAEADPTVVARLEELVTTVERSGDATNSAVEDLRRRLRRVEQALGIPVPPASEVNGA
jgi:hypothetical protein